jgi:hypothetical protein
VSPTELPLRSVPSQTLEFRASRGSRTLVLSDLRITAESAPSRATRDQDANNSPGPEGQTQRAKGEAFYVVFGIAKQIADCATSPNDEMPRVLESIRDRFFGRGDSIHYPLTGFSHISQHVFHGRAPRLFAARPMPNLSAWFQSNEHPAARGFSASMNALGCRMSTDRRQARTRTGSSCYKGPSICWFCKCTVSFRALTLGAACRSPEASMGSSKVTLLKQADFRYSAMMLELYG